MNLEKVDLEGKIGKVGTYSVDLTPKLTLKVAVGVELPLIQYLKDAAAKTGTPVDDQAIAWVESVLLASQPAAEPAV